MTMSDAKKALALAKEHLERASNDPEDPDEVFVWGFYSLENAVVAAAEKAGEVFARNHWSKSAAARKLAQKHGLTDVSGLLSDLNEARKGSAYGDVDESDMDPEETLESIKGYVVEVEKFLQQKTGKKGK